MIGLQSSSADNPGHVFHVKGGEHYERNFLCQVPNLSWILTVVVDYEERKSNVTEELQKYPNDEEFCCCI